MNENIRRLLAQAYLEQADIRDTTKIAERFAELIVRECAKRIDYWESRQGEHCDDLLKHFGVDGMSTEDKKTLIKELLGVKND